RQITLIDDQGNEELYEILFTFHSDDYDKSYVLLYPAAVGDDEDIEVQAFSYDADDAGDVTSSDLHEIESDDEWDMVRSEERRVGKEGVDEWTRGRCIEHQRYKT